MTIGSGADQIDLYYFGPGHTNGDAWVVFPAHRIVHAGDIFAGKDMPLVDGNNGGSVLHYSETLMKAYNGIKNVDTIINGHMPAQTTWADLKEFADFNKDFLTWAQAELKAGKTPEQAAAGVEGAREVQGLFDDRLTDDGRPGGTASETRGRDEEVVASASASVRLQGRARTARPSATFTPSRRGRAAAACSGSTFATRVTLRPLFVIAVTSTSTFPSTGRPRCTGITLCEQ